MRVLPARDPDGRDRAPDRRVRQDVVRARSAPRSSTGPAGAAAAATRSPRRRPMSGWRRSRCARRARALSRSRARRRWSSWRSAPTFSLICEKPSAHGLEAEAHELLVVVAQPARRRRIGGISLGEQASLALGASGLGRAQQAERVLAREGVVDVAEVDEVDDLLRGEVGQQLPQRLARPPSPQVPGGVDDRADRHVGDALLRSQPARRAVAHEQTREGAEVIEHLVEREAEHERLERRHRGDLDLVAAADREDQAGALLT